jgi:hypothetical protein
VVKIHPAHHPAHLELRIFGRVPVTYSAVRIHPRQAFRAVFFGAELGEGLLMHLWRLFLQLFVLLQFFFLAFWLRFLIPAERLLVFVHLVGIRGNKALLCLHVFVRGLF